MKIAKRFLVAGTAATIGIASLAGVGVSAQSTSQEGLINRLAEAFNVSQEEVQTVFDEEKTARQAELAEERSEDLQTLVDDGTITAEQKSTIEAKQSELQTQRESQKEELEAWAEENDIDAKYLMGVRGNSERSEQRLQSLVDDGTITAEQKSTIEAKQSELQTQRESQKEELEAWAEENDIDAKYLMGGANDHGKRGGFRR